MEGLTYKVDMLLQNAFEDGCSDVFLVSDRKPRVKINGRFIEYVDEKLDHNELSHFLNTAFNPSATDIIKNKEIDFSYTILSSNDDLINFRVSGIAVKSKERRHAFELTIRTIPDAVPTLDSLRIPGVLPKCLETYSHGMFIVSGPTGSGKTTTLAALIHDLADKTEKRIITYEAPIEYIHSSDSIVQTEVYTHIEDFSRAMRSSLRRAPDVIMYGELRDKETIHGAVSVSKTGHLVLVTTHTNSVEATIPRLLDEFDESERHSSLKNLVSNVRGILHQRLYPNLNGGRIGLFSYLIFDKDVRNILMSKNVDGTNLEKTISQLLRERGVTIPGSALEHFKSGNLGLETLIEIYQEFKTEIDTSEIISCISELNASNRINGQQASEWMQIIYSFSPKGG